MELLANLIIGVLVFFMMWAVALSFRSTVSYLWTEMFDEKAKKNTRRRRWDSDDEDIRGRP